MITHPQFGIFTNVFKLFTLTIISFAGFSAGVLHAQNSNVSTGVAAPREVPAKSTVRGRVYYSDTGRAVRRASMVLISEDVDAGSTAELSGVTDSVGLFQIKNVKAGVYYAMVNAPGVVSPLSYADFSKVGGGRSEKEAFETAFTYFEKIIVNGLTDVEVQVPAVRGGAIGGTVTYDDGDPAIGVRVEIFRKVDKEYVPVVSNLSSLSSMMGGGGRTDDRGVYRFPGLPPGEYRVKVTENAVHAENEERNYLSSFNAMFGTQSFLSVYYPDVFDVKQSKLVSVILGVEATEINITIPGRNIHRIAGKLVAAKDKTPIRGAHVKIRKDVETESSLFQQLDILDKGVKTDADGNWSFKELPKGKYRVVIEPDEFLSENEIDAINANTNSARRSNAPPKRKFAKKTEIVMIEDKDVEGLIIELGYGATVSGTVVTEGTTEMPASMNVMAVNPGSVFNTGDRIGSYEDEPGTPKIDRDFKLERLPAGDTYFSVRLTDDDFYLKSMTLDGKDLLAGPVELRDGEDLKNVKIVVAKATGILKGKITGADGEPVSNGKFILVPLDRIKRENGSFEREVTSGEKGEFEVKLGPGEYVIVFTSILDEPGARSETSNEAVENVLKNSQKVTIREKETTTVSIKRPLK